VQTFINIISALKGIYRQINTKLRQAKNAVHFSSRYNYQTKNKKITYDRCSEILKYGTEKPIR